MAVLALCSCAPASPNGNLEAPSNTSNTSNEVADPTKEVPYDLQSVDFVNISHGWIVGSDVGNNVSVILRTSDGGATWIEAAEIIGDTLLKVDFADERNGWTVGTEGVVYATSDGGLTWALDPSSPWPAVYSHEDTQLPAQGDKNIAPVVNQSVASVFFLDERTGWAVGDTPVGKSLDVRGLVLTTADGGKTWKDVSGDSDGRPQYLLNDVWFTSQTEGWAAGGNIEDNQEDVLLHTSDGGRTWERRPMNVAQYPRAVQFADKDHGWVCGMTIDGATDSPGPSKILATSDSGATWTVQFTSPRSFYDICFADATHGWVVGDRASIYSTRDGGKTWRQQLRFETKGSRQIRAPSPDRTNSRRSLRTVLARDAKTVIAAGDGVIEMRKQS